MENIRFISIREIFAISLSILISLGIYLSRIGFINFPKEILASVSLLLIIIFVPKIFYYFLKKFYEINSYMEKFFKFFFLIFLILISIFLNYFPLNLINFLLILGSIFFVIYIWYSIKFFYKNLLFIIFLLVFAIWSISAFSSNFYSTPLSYEQLSVGAYFHRDTLWHSAIAGMFKNYLIPSLGIDGLLFYNYHIFSNVLFGSISNILGVSTFSFYTIYLPIIFIPLFFLYFLELVFEFCYVIKSNIGYSLEFKSPILFYSVILILFGILIPINLTSEKYHFFISHSYFVAFIFTFLLLSIFLNLFRTNFFDNKFNLNSFVIYLTLAFLFFIVTISKFSFLYFINVSFFFFYLRLKLFKNINFTILFIFILIVSSITFIYFIHPFAFYNSSFGYRDSTLSTINNLIFQFLESSKTYYSIIYPSLIFIFFKIVYLNLYLFKNLKKLFFKNELLDCEFLIYLSIALLIFPWQYTNGIQIYVAYFFILSNIPFFYNNFKSLTFLKKIFISLIILISVFFSTSNIAKTFLSYISQNLSIRESFLNNNNVYIDADNDGILDYVNKGIRDGGLTYISKYRKNIISLINLDFKYVLNLIDKVKKIDPLKTEFSNEYQLLFKLEELQNFTDVARNNLAIYFPRNINFYNNISCDTHLIPFLVPSISNLSLISGIPDPKKISCYGHKYGYGYNKYYINFLDNIDNYHKELSRDEICYNAQKRKFDKVIKFYFTNNKLIYKLIDCK